MAKKNRTSTDPVTDCACVIHGETYSWDYVEKLYRMLSRHLPNGIRLHVYTEAHRTVPSHMIKHELVEWPGVNGPKRSWWYKMQLFDNAHFSGPLLYLDLDVVVYNNLNWVREAHLDCFWTIRDFRYLQKPGYDKMNSSLMYWDTTKFGWVWDKFCEEDISKVVTRWPGDQDYINQVIQPSQRRYFDDQHFQSFRWQALDGGMNFRSRKANQPGGGIRLSPDASVLVFHGKPKPHEVTHPQIQQLWN